MEKVVHINIFKKILALVTNRILFSVIYLITALLWYFPITSLYFDLPMKVVFIWGIFLIIYDFFTKRVMFSGYGSFWLVLFGISYAITILLNTEMLYDGIKHFVYNGILIYIIYCFASDRTEEEYKKWLVVMNDIILVIVFAASLISIVMFAARFTYIFTRGDITFSQGIVYNRLHGVYTSANTGAILSMLSIGLMGINYIFNKSHFKRFRWFYILNGIIQFLYYSLTLSKGGHLILVSGLIALSGVFVYPHFLKNMKKIVAAAMAAVCLFAAVGITELATVGARKVMLLLPTAVSMIKSSAADSDEPIEEIKLERVDSDNEITNGRISIWQAGIALLKESPIFGVGEARVYSGDKLIADIDEDALSEQNISELKRVDGYMHNAVIQILVFSGISGLLIIALFAFCVAKKYISALIRLYGSKVYASAAIIFVFLFMLLSQVVNEAHVLFNRQDPYAVMFWLYLGFGTYIIRNKIGLKESRSLFICDTPYQIMNSVRIAYADSGKSDIYIYGQFRNAEQISDNLKKSKIFSNVMFFRKYKSYSGIIQKLATFFRICLPEFTLRRHFSGRLQLHPYENIYLSCFTSFTDSTRLLNSGGCFIQYEDGIGSYLTKNLENHMRSRVFKFINKFVLNGKLSYNINTLYLNQPDLYTFGEYNEIKKIPSESGEVDLKEIFGYIYNELYVAHRFVYITQPLKETAAGNSSEKIESEIISAFNDKVLVRVHPRQNAADYKQCMVDTQNNLWELECAEQITDSHVLIGAFSTAQFTPKMLYDKEPTVIFTYKLYGNAFENVDETVEMLRSMYRNPEKVIVAEDINRLSDFINKER
mgnify:CR=1 FL=1